MIASVCFWSCHFHSEFLILGRLSNWCKIYGRSILGYMDKSSRISCFLGYLEMKWTIDWRWFFKKLSNWDLCVWNMLYCLNIKIVGDIPTASWWFWISQNETKQQISSRPAGNQGGMHKSLVWVFAGDHLIQNKQLLSLRIIWYDYGTLFLDMNSMLMFPFPIHTLTNEVWWKWNTRKNIWTCTSVSSSNVPGLGAIFNSQLYMLFVNIYFIFLIFLFLVFYAYFC